MEFQDVVRRRKMVRSFEDRAVSRELVEKLLANAQKAPSAGFSQAYAFLVFDGRDEVERFWSAADPERKGWRPKWPDIYNAPVVIVPCSEKDVALDRYARPDKGWTDRSESHWPVPYWDVDTAMATMLILLTAVDLGLGAIFFGLFHTKEIKEAFGIPERVTPLGAIAVGHPKPNDRPSPSIKTVGRRPAQQVVHRGHWGTRAG
ncbi:MAG: nitroreductase family protein [Chloroflexota bacterium]|nr:nitroreductase family protein [Chloroflexota bacterium]MDE3193706.1 nitroreductase family protein [Chloroflexota bacterium]